MKTMQRVVARRVTEALRSVEGNPADEDCVACGVLRGRAAGIRIAHGNCAALAPVPVGCKPAFAPPGVDIDARQAGIAPHAGADAAPRTFRFIAAERGGFACHFTHRLPFFGGRRERGIERAFDVEAAP
ncbi:quinol oxidase [Burkholderia sp. Bp9017]|uniref:Quinol oxidase n=1 Tax=Burkholderia anthina TaxID=179879 RepID=A0A7T6VG98_9BURK|nr:MULTISPECIES: quinol oxidase [Burkholderia]MBY4868666.1 quinol oxidase [Burkholderia anthina]QQK03350.1 quinol oxidase [Burkholderia anthina]RQZ18907.1 quinol oxidase [Burkholderia sp. Bp9017]RQZ28560.1 quinol oxidase [Burkholderia sp. Bp9016]